jgi:hypothetical protein
MLVPSGLACLPFQRFRELPGCCREGERSSQIARQASTSIVRLLGILFRFFLVNERNQETMSQRLSFSPISKTPKQSVMQFLRDASAFSDRSIILDLSFLARAHLNFIPAVLSSTHDSSRSLASAIVWALIFSRWTSSTRSFEDHDRPASADGDAPKGANSSQQMFEVPGMVEAENADTVHIRQQV